MYGLYRYLTGLSGPFLCRLLIKRQKRGKEDAARLDERRGIAGIARPSGPLVWLHAASVGESQSALILVRALLKHYKNLHILVTTGTVTSAQMMAKNLPDRAFHQFMPLDHPLWVSRFLDHWRPDLALWMESELWPNILRDIKKRGIPAVLVNARLSDQSYKRWRWFQGMARTMLDAFTLIICQTKEGEKRFRSLGMEHVITSDNLKYSAAALVHNPDDLTKLSAHIMNRPVWLYASSHKGEEALACRIHERLKITVPDLLTIIVPRHPDRRAEIADICASFSLNTVFRGEAKKMPAYETDIYVADTLGELGLFYRLAPVACIGRSFSDDGGGGHNPVEAAQLDCAVLHGPHVQYQTQIYDDMREAGAAIKVNTEQELFDMIRRLFNDQGMLYVQQEKGRRFEEDKNNVINVVMQALDPVLKQAGLS